MFHTGLDKYRTATVDNFTSDIGIKIRRIFLGKLWRRIIKLCTRRKIVVEQYPNLNKNEVYVFCCNHSFDEDYYFLRGIG